MITKSKSLEQVKSFALIRLASVLHRLHQKETMISIAKRCKTNASTLSGIKNDRYVSVSLQRVLTILRRLDVEYTLSESYRSNITYYSFESEGTGYFGRSDRNKVDIKTTNKKVIKADPNQDLRWNH